MTKERVLKNMKRLIAVVPALGAGAGCYQYASAPLTAVQPGQAVRVTLSPAAAGALASTIGPGATSLDGRVLQRTDADLTLALTQIARGPDEPEQFLQNERLTLPVANASSFAVRALDKPRSVLAVGSVVALVIAGRAFINQPGIFSTKGSVSQSTK